MTSLIKCRKCGGPHVTLRCGKETTDTSLIGENNNNSSNKHFGDKQHDKQHYKQHDKQFIDKRKIVTVRINNLPDDITVEELHELVSEWGMIGRINISSYESKSGFIDFYNMNEAEYFVKALDRTPFDRLIIRVEILEKDS